MVECDLAKVEVAGSNPVFRSNDIVSFGTLSEKGVPKIYVKDRAP